jgi:hypothetical protein
METCQNCQGTGFLCTKGHGVKWQGSEPCPEEYEEMLDNWVRYHIREEPWEEGPTVSTLPVRDVDALTYLAFLADFNVLYQRLTFDERGSQQFGGSPHAEMLPLRLEEDFPEYCAQARFRTVNRRGDYQAEYGGQ